jgi:hypothetical protein
MAPSMRSTRSTDTPAGRVMDEAIELSIQGRSPYPDRAWFLDADMPDLGKWIARATDEGKAVVLVAEDGSARVLHPEAAAASQ